MLSRVRSLRILLVTISLCHLFTGGCSDKDPVAPGCPSPTVDGLTPVENLTISDHPILHATITLNWNPPLPNPAELAVEKYEVRAQTSGEPITDGNWCTLPVLGTLPSGDKIGFFAQFNHQDEGIIPGAMESFAVRPIYENGDLGPVGTVLTHRPTAPFTLEGLVRDDMTVPIPGITVRMMQPFGIPETIGVVTSVQTGPDGRFPPLGPISDQAAMVVATDSPDTLTTPDAEDSYFDFTTEPISSGANPTGITITLITRYTYEHPPGGWLAEYFSGWVQMMVIAQYVEGEYRLRKWDDYDLRVFVPEGLNSDGTVDLAAECRLAMATWNEALGLQIFSETQERDDAKIEVQFLDMPNHYGKVSLDIPPGHYFNGRIIPERALLKINPSVRLNNAAGTIMHEFGHSLGVYGHSGNPNHLLATASYCCLGQDELRLIHTIMNLPQNCLMSNFERGMPWPMPGPN